MKQLIIISVTEFEKKIVEILGNNQVASFTYYPVTGYQQSRSEPLKDNWFGSAFHSIESLLFTVFVPASISEQIFRDIEELNETCGLESRVHLIIQNIEKYI